MSQQNNNDGNGGPNVRMKPVVPWGTKVGYVGTGILIGLIVYPFVRRAVSQLQPKMDKLFDDLTGKAEGFAEKTSDLLARAKESLRRSEAQESKHRHEHRREHEHGPDDEPSGGTFQ